MSEDLIQADTASPLIEILGAIDRGESISADDARKLYRVAQIECEETAERLRSQVRELTDRALTDASVGAYIGCSAEQVRLMRLHRLSCDACSAIHVGFPTIRAFHSPLCPERIKCASCGAAMSGLSCEHFTQQIGAICGACSYENSVTEAAIRSRSRRGEG